MEIKEIISALDCLNKDNPSGCTGDINELLERNLHETLNALKIKHPNVETAPWYHQPNDNVQDETPIWRYIVWNFYLLFKLQHRLGNSNEMLSVQENISIKNNLNDLVTLGIRCNILPKFKCFIRIETICIEDERKVRLLSATTSGFVKLVECVKLRTVLVPNFLHVILSSLYQMIYCPIKKPTNDHETILYNALINQREASQRDLDNLFICLPKSIYTRDTMRLLENTGYIWLQKAVNSNLNKILFSDNGLETIVVVLLEHSDGDSSKSWKAVDLINKLLFNLRKSNFFQSNICEQIRNLLNNKSHEFVYIECIKAFYVEDEVLVCEEFLDKLMQIFWNFSNVGYKFERDDVTGEVLQIVRILHAGFIRSSVHSKALPLHLLEAAISILFRLFALNCKEMQQELKQILIAYLIKFKSNRLFDTLVFDLPSNEILPFRNDIEILVDGNRLKVIKSTNLNNVGVNFLKLCEENVDLLESYFKYLLECNGNKLFVYHTLSLLSENKAIQEHINKNPKNLIEFIGGFLKKNADDQMVFVVVMILQALIVASEDLDPYRVLSEDLDLIKMSTNNEELRALIGDIAESLQVADGKNGARTKFDEAMDDVMDPMLPIRGHGLMALAKLVEEKDESVMERKQYLLNVFQQNLKNEDSFIYLAAINGLGVMGDAYPKLVLDTLINEYTDFNKSDVELKLKIGEALVRITKNLGTSAIDYKAVLLNTFLLGAKDDDHLIRASSLSNLGEVCKVLSNKLGTIVVEVLECVHRVIETDSAVEARRAAVAVFTQLFVGLEHNTIGFLKDDIARIYATLRKLYDDDSDDVMKLHAQLALEELSENLKKISVIESNKLNE